MANLNNIYRGDDVSYTVTFKDANSVAIDITGSTVFFTVKNFSDTVANDTAALISKTITTHTTPLSGITTISLTAAETAAIVVGSYKYDIQYKSATNVVRTVTSGTIQFLDDVTKRSS